jgi:hypothetical protein
MSLRESINKHPKVTVVAVLVLAGASVAFALKASGSGAEGLPTKDYYTADEGASYFEAEADKVVPFDHQGKQAYRARVFRYGNGKPFVGYVERLTAEGMQKMEELKSKSGPDVAEQRAVIAGKHSEVRKPKDTSWIKANSPASSRVTAFQPPPGANGELEPVIPGVK